MYKRTWSVHWCANMPRKLKQATVRELLHYNPRTGQLHWQWWKRKWFKTEAAHRRWNTRYATKQAFISKDTHGYYQGRIFRIKYLAARIIFLYMKGYMPKQVDHKNRKRTDDRWTNLRAANNLSNSHNRSLHSNNTSGHAGVQIIRGNHYAYISNGKRIRLGSFPNLKAAVAARKVAERKYGFAHAN
jgi:hypothetical protein